MIQWKINGELVTNRHPKNYQWSLSRKIAILMFLRYSHLYYGCLCAEIEGKLRQTIDTSLSFFLHLSLTINYCLLHFCKLRCSFVLLLTKMWSWNRILWWCRSRVGLCLSTCYCWHLLTQLEVCLQHGSSPASQGNESSLQFCLGAKRHGSNKSGLAVSRDASTASASTLCAIIAYHGITPRFIKSFLLKVRNMMEYVMFMINAYFFVLISYCFARLQFPRLLPWEHLPRLSWLRQSLQQALGTSIWDHSAIFNMNGTTGNCYVNTQT